MAPKLKQGLTVVAAVGAAAIGGTAIAGATGDRSTATDRQGRPGEMPPPGAYGSGGGPPGRHHHGPGGPGRGERALTGATADEVEVKVNRAFEVTAVEAHRHPGPPRRP